MKDPRCSRTGLLLYILYITSSGLLRCASSSYPGNNFNNDGLPRPVSVATSNPWSQKYITNPNILFKATAPTEIANQHMHYLSPEERTMTQVERIASKKTPGNYMYPEIPHPHKTPVHACLAGYDGEFFEIIKDIKQTSGDEIEVHFYLFHRCKFNLLSSHMTTVKALQDVLTKYHHYICLNKKFVETYKAKEHCWYIEKLIMIPSYKNNFDSLPHNMKIDDFSKDGFEPLVLRTEEKVNPGEDIKKIEEYENEHELTLRDLSGMAYGGNAAANLNRISYPNSNLNRYIPNLLPGQSNIPTATQSILPVKENINLSDCNNQMLVTNPCGAYSKKSSTYNQAASYTQGQSLYTGRGTSQNSFTEGGSTVANYIQPLNCIGAYNTVPSYTAHSSTASPYQKMSSYVTNPTGVSYTQSGENLINRNWESNKISTVGYQIPPSVTFPTVCGENHDQASYSVSRNQFQPNYVTPYYSKTQNYNQRNYNQQKYNQHNYNQHKQQSYNQQSYNPQSYNQPSYNQQRYNQQSYYQQSYNRQRYNQQSYNPQSYNQPSYNQQSYNPQSYNQHRYNQISSYTPSPKNQIWPASNFVTPSRNFQQELYNKPNEINNQEITYSLHSHSHVSNSPSSGLNVFYTPQINEVSNGNIEKFNKINAYSPKKLFVPDYTRFTSGEVNPTSITPSVYHAKPLNNFVTPITQNIASIPKYTQPLKEVDIGYNRFNQPNEYIQKYSQPISPSSLNIQQHDNNRFVHANYQTRPSHFATPTIWSPSPKLYTPKYEGQSVEYSKPLAPIFSQHTSIYSPEVTQVTNTNQVKYQESASNKNPWYSPQTNRKLPDYQSMPFYSRKGNGLSPKTDVNQNYNAFDSNNQGICPIQPQVKSDEIYNTISKYTPRNYIKPTFEVGKSGHNVSYNSYAKPESNVISSYTPKRITPDYKTLSTPAPIQELETPQFQRISSYMPFPKVTPGHKLLPYAPLALTDDASRHMLREGLALDSQMWPKTTSPKYTWPTTSNSIESYTRAPIKLDTGVLSSYKPSTHYNKKYDNIPSYTQPVYNTGTQQYINPSNIQPVSTQAAYPSTSSYMQPRTYKPNVISSYIPTMKIKAIPYKLEVTPELLPNHAESVVSMPRPSTIAETIPYTGYPRSRLSYKQNFNTIPYYTPRQETLERGGGGRNMRTLGTPFKQSPTENLGYEPSHKFVSPHYGTRINYESSQNFKIPNLNVISSYTQPQTPILDTSSVSFTSPQNIWNKPRYETIPHYTPYRSNTPLQLRPISYVNPFSNIVSSDPITISTSPQNQPKYEQATILAPNMAIYKPRLERFKLPSPSSQPVFNNIPNYKQHPNYITQKIPSWGGLMPVMNQELITPSDFEPNLNAISSYTSQLKPNIVPLDIPQNVIPQYSRTPTQGFNKIESYTPRSQQRDTSILSQVPFARQPSYDVPHTPTQNQFRQIYNTVSAYTPRQQISGNLRPVAYTQQAMNVIPRYSTIAVEIPEALKPEHSKISYTYTPTTTPFTPTQKVKPQLMDRIPSYSQAKNIKWPNFTTKTAYQPEYGTRAIPLAEKVRYSSNAINSYSKVRPNIYNRPLTILSGAGPIYQPTQTYKPQKVQYPNYDMINAYTRPTQVINQGFDSVRRGYLVVRPIQPLHMSVDSQPSNGQTMLQPKYGMMSWPKLPQFVKPKYDEIRFYTPKKPDVITPAYQVSTTDALRTQFSNTVISYTPHLKTVQRTSPEYTQLHYTPTQTTNVHYFNIPQIKDLRNNMNIIPSYTSRPDTPVGVPASRTSICPNIPLSQIRENNVFSPYSQSLDNTKRDFNVIPEYTQPQSYRGYKPKYPGESNENYFKTPSSMPNLMSIPSYTPRLINTKPDYIPTSTPVIMRPHTVSMPSFNQWPKTYQQKVNIISKPSYTQKTETIRPNFVSVSPFSQYTPSTYLSEGIRPYGAPLWPQNRKLTSRIPDLISIPSYTPRPILTRPHSVSIPSYTSLPTISLPDLVTVCPSNQEIKSPDALDLITSYTKPLTSNSFLKSPYSQWPVNKRPEFDRIPQYKLWPETKRSDIVSIPSYNQIPTKILPDMVSIPTYKQRPQSISPNIVIPRYTQSMRSNFDTISSYTARPKSTRPGFAPISSYPNKKPETVSRTARPTYIQQNFVSIPKYTPSEVNVRPISDPINPCAQQTNNIPSYTQNPTNRSPNIVSISSYSQSPTRIRPDLISFPTYSANPASNSLDFITISPSIRTPERKRPVTYNQPLQPSYIKRSKYDNVISSYSQLAGYINTASNINSPKPDVIPWYTKRPNSIVHQPYQIPYSKSPNLDVISSYTKRPDVLTPSYQPDGTYPYNQRPCSINPYRGPCDTSPELNVIPNYSTRPNYQRPFDTRPEFSSASAYRPQPHIPSQHVMSIPSYTTVKPTYSSTVPCAERSNILNPDFVSTSPWSQPKTTTQRYNSIPTLPNVNDIPCYTNRPTSNRRSNFVSNPQSISTQSINYTPRYDNVPHYTKAQVKSTGNWVTKSIAPDFYQIKSYTKPYVPSSQIPLVSANLYSQNIKSFDQIKQYTPNSLPSQVSSKRPYVPCVPQLNRPFVPCVPPSYQPRVPCVPQTNRPFVPCVPPSYQPGVPCVPQSNGPFVPCVPPSYQPCVPCVPQSNRPFVPCVPPPYQPRVPCVPQSNRPLVPCVPQSNRPFVPCVPPSYQPRVPCVPQSNRPFVPCVPKSNRPYVPCVPPSYQPRIPCVPQSNRPFVPCVPPSYQPRVPCVPQPNRPFVPYVPSSYQPRTPCTQPFNQIESYTKPCASTLQPIKTPENLYSPCEQPYNQIKSYTKPCVPTSQPITSPEQSHSLSQQPYNQIESYTRPCAPTIQPSVQSPLQSTSFTNPFEQSTNKLLYTKPNYENKSPDYINIPEYSYNPTGFKETYQTFASFQTPTSQIHKNIPSVAPISHTVISYAKPINQQVKYDTITSYTSSCKRVSHTKPYIQINKYTDLKHESFYSDRQSKPQYAPYTRPCVPSMQSRVPCVPSNQHYRPCVPVSYQSRVPCVPSSYQPRVPYIPPSNQPCEPCIPPSNRPCVPCVPPSNQPCIPCVPISYQPRVPCVPQSNRPYVPCVPPSNRPCVPWVPQSNRPYLPCAHSSNQPYGPCVPPSNRPCVPCVPPSNRPCVPWVPPSNRLCVPCVPPSNRPCLPWVPSSNRPCLPCVSPSNRPCVPCVPPSNQLCVPCVPVSYQSSVPSVPPYYQPRVPYTPPSNQPYTPCMPISYQPRNPCVQASYRPRVPSVSPSYQPRIPCKPYVQASYRPQIHKSYVPSSYQPRVPCMPVFYQPRVPCVPVSYRPRVPLYQPRVPYVSPTYQYANNIPNGPCVPPYVPSIPCGPYQGTPWVKQQPLNTNRQDFDDLNGQYNNMRNETNIVRDSSIKYVTDTILKAAKGDISCLKGVIPLNKIVLGVVNKLNDKVPYCSRRIDPNVELRGFVKKVKILKPKLVFETEEVDITNFVPVVKCNENRHPNFIQNMAVDFIKRRYKCPLIVNKTDPFYKPFVMVKNMDISPDKPLIWPAVFERDTSRQRSC